MPDALIPLQRDGAVSVNFMVTVVSFESSNGLPAVAISNKSVIVVKIVVALWASGLLSINNKT